jgi:hypothetical protein
MSETAPPANRKRTQYPYPEELTVVELAALEQALPDDVTAHHLRWLETGEGTPWPESFG